MVGLDVGLKEFLTDSEGNTVENPRFYRKTEKTLNRANRQKSKKFVKREKTSIETTIIKRGFDMLVNI